MIPEVKEQTLGVSTVTSTNLATSLFTNTLFDLTVEGKLTIEVTALSNFDRSTSLTTVLVISEVTTSNFPYTYLGFSELTSVLLDTVVFKLVLFEGGIGPSTIFTFITSSKVDPLKFKSRALALIDQNPS
jgi:hypothetical protein